jgi:hypothetical protein
MELARNLIVASVLLALARRSQDWLVTLFAYATILIFVGHYLTYVLDAIMQMELPRSWRPYIGKWVLGSAFMDCGDRPRLCRGRDLFRPV